MRGSFSGVRRICTALVLYLLVFASCVSFPANPAASPQTGAPDQAALRVNSEQGLPPEPVPEPVLFTGDAYSLFIHPLIVNPEKAFVKGDSYSFMDRWFVTVGEFRAILEELYARNYILIRPSDIYSFDAAAKTVSKKDLYLPPGKYPVLFSADDVNYYETMKRNGTNRRLVLDESGRVASEYEDESGVIRVSRDAEFVGILEDFIARYPDFSYNGARGVIALTGYFGVFGYDTHKLSSPSYKADFAAAQAVAQALKQSGWDFASHSYGHIDMGKTEPAKVTADCNLWKQTVEAVIGPTDIFIYPFGAEPKKYPENLQLLQNAGFRFYFGVGQGTYNRWFPSYALVRRRELDGVYFRSDDVKLSPFFDVAKVFRVPRS